MKKALVIVALLSVVAMANAEIRIFWTLSNQPFGLTNQGVANPVSGEMYEFTPSAADVSDDYAEPPVYDNNLDATDGHYALTAAPAYTDAFTGEINVNENPGVFAYMWMQFVGENNGIKLINAVFDYTLDGNTAWMPSEVTYYKMDDMGGEGTKRWDGRSTMPGYPEFEMDPQNLAAVSTFGIRNRHNSADEWNMFDYTTRTALLGAVRLSDLGEYSVVIPGDINGDPLFVVASTPRTPTIMPFTVTPEPASMLLLGLAGLLIRRR